MPAAPRGPGRGPGLRKPGTPDQRAGRGRRVGQPPRSPLVSGPNAQGLRTPFTRGSAGAHRHRRSGPVPNDRSVPPGRPFGERTGGKHDCAVAKPQVTDPGLRGVKIVRIFEFMPLNSAPDRIRTCAHGSGEGLLCTPLTSGNEFRHTRSGGVSGAVRPVLQRTDASAFRVGSGGHWPPGRGWPIRSGR